MAGQDREPVGAGPGIPDQAQSDGLAGAAPAEGAAAGQADPDPNLGDVPLTALRAFAAAGRAGSFRAAAEGLGVTQGAVAQQVRGLEARLGLALFLRRARGLTLTDAGRRYHGAISDALDRIARATAELRPEPARVTVSVTPTLASKWLIPRLADFTARHPGIDLRISATERVERFHADAVDLAIRQSEPPFGASLRADLLFRQQVVAVCAPHLLAGQRLPLRARALAGMTLLHDTHGLWPVFFDGLAGGMPRGTRGLRFSQTSLCLDAALAGQGVALASRFLVRRDLAEGRLASPVDHVLSGVQDFHLIAPRAATGEAQAIVRDWLLRMARSEGGEA
ncbi:LysR substrate-binding domain-containing protein [Pseudooceanicola aestuarii]|uniref:LysR substrate-binding domain-containing protein n=1 Tax=Pseudooceanicola aestuarii TaxID=2697319 RepID=UPI0013D1F0CB|nr:LysR substrate-binding domain-containing protein [Pseudooceanicola aestuarii]